MYGTISEECNYHNYRVGEQYIRGACLYSMFFVPLADWVTSDLISKIEQSPVLSNALRDPQLAQVLAQFQANPQATMAAAGNNPKLQHFLSEFCTLMGDHFTALADDDEKAKVVGGVKQGGGGGDGRGRAASKPLISEIPSQADDAARKYLV